MQSRFTHRGSILGAAIALSFAAAPAQAQGTPPGLAACQAGFETVLQPPAQTFDARAVWLSRDLLQWPGAAAAHGLRFRLYHAAGSGIAAPVGGRASGADGALDLVAGSAPAALAARFRHLAAGPVLAVPAADRARLAALHRGQLVLVQEDAHGTVRAATRIQHAAALDDLHAAAAEGVRLGATVERGRATDFRVWAPTAQQAALCLYDDAGGAATAIMPMQRDDASGVWSARVPRDLSGRYYRYVVDVHTASSGLVRNLVTDPYSVSLTTDSKRSYIADLASPATKPAGWDAHKRPRPLAAQTDMTIYELHVRDFSINDPTVPAAHRGKYLAFADARANGARHLRALARAGLTDVHLLPIFDLATVPEAGCVTPQVQGAPDGEEQQAAVQAVAAKDCFNWGYDPYHFNAPEGSYATDPSDGAVRVRELRRMVMALHGMGLRVGMDVVYNHTTVSGQKESSVLDRIVPGYYHRLDAAGAVERSTCCDNTATEHRMMGKLMIDSTVLWTKEYGIDSFRFDLMGHQPRDVMEALQKQVNAAAGRHVHLIGEGWNFGEVADGARFVQASQLSLNGSGIGTFSDRMRDAARGGGPAESGRNLIASQGWLNGLVYDPNALGGGKSASDLLRAADMVRVGLAGSLRDVEMTDHRGRRVKLSDIVYGGSQPAGYVSQPGEVVNYVENHDNQTLFDINVFKLPRGTSAADRARVQMLGAALVAFSQGVAYYHAGMDTLRSKSLDRNSYDSGDWFNRIDWSYRDNYFGTGLPPRQDNAGRDGEDWALMKPLLADAAIRPAPRDIAFARDAFRDLLKIRASSTLFRLRTADDVQQRLHLVNTGPQQKPTVVGARLDGEGYAGAGFREIVYFINAGTQAEDVAVPELQGRRFALHPVHTARGAADRRAREARHDAATGRFLIPARTAVVFVRR